VNNTTTIITIFCLLTPLYSQSSLSFSLGTEYYMNQAQYKDASGFAIDYMRHMSSDSEMGIRFNYNIMSYNIDAPSTTTVHNVAVYNFLLVYGYNPGYELLSMNLKPLLGAGLKILNRAAMQVDLGALGKESVPQLSKSYFTFYSGLLMEKGVSRILSFFIEPGFAFYDLKAFNRSFLIKGGINVQFN
jgi:hypothetical protein